MSATRLFPKLRLNQAWDLQARSVVNNAVAGKLNVVGEITLAANAVSTTLADPLITQGSHIGLMPMTANAAAAMAGLHFAPSATGSVTIFHANNGQSDRTFRYAILG
jgi:hypothetical protein